MAEICGLDRNFVSGLPPPKRVFKMEPMKDEQDCICVIESVNTSFYAEDHPKITVTLRSSTSEISAPEINNKCATSFSEYRLDTAFEPAEVTHTKSSSAQTTMHSLSLGTVRENENVTVETAGDNNGRNFTLENNTFSSSAGNHLNDDFVSKDKCAQPIVNECDILNVSLPTDKCDNLKKTTTSSPSNSGGSVETVVSSNCHQRETECQLSQTELENDLINIYESTEEDSCFATEIQMICESEDLFPESSELIIASENECFSEHAYCSSTLESVRQSSSSDCFNCDLKSESPAVYQNFQEDFTDDQYENIELSSIFSSTDIYQRSFDQSYAANSISPSQENDSSSNFITDLDSRSCERFIADSGVFGLSLSDSGSELFQSDGMQYPHVVSSAQSETVGNRTGQDKSCDSLFKPEGPFSTSVSNSTHMNASLFSTRVTNNPQVSAALYSDPSTQLNNVQTGCHEHCWGVQHKSTATSTFNSAGLSFCCNTFDTPPTVPAFYDPCINDYHRYIYHSPYSHSTSSTEWKSWFKGSTTYDSPTSFITSKPSEDDVCPVSSTDIRGSVAKPDIVQFIEINAQDEEETDDADEVDYLPVCFNTKSDLCASHVNPQSAGTSEYHSENSTGYSPSVLTPPPSASSTPAPSTTQESTCDELDMSASLPLSHYNTSQIYASPTGPAFIRKLKQEQLDTSLLSFGLSQGAKRPFPSMADAMRSSRSKTSTRKKGSPEGSDQQPRRSGRPRKTQIQSDTISTTAVSNKQRKKVVSKQKSELPVQDVKNLKSSEDKVVAGSSNRMPGTSRHNEPLNQHAIGIMSQWFEDHIDNPYPSKADKEQIAIQGGITENQVKSWFANKRNRTNNTKPKVQKRAMEEKLKEIFRDLKRNHQNPMADNSHVIQQLSGIIQHCHSAKLP